jgi:RimJ/RimL family protein N-acetyltransferase
MRGALGTHSQVLNGPTWGQQARDANGGAGLALARCQLRQLCESRPAGSQPSNHHRQRFREERGPLSRAVGLVAPRLLGYRLCKTISFDPQPHLVGETLELRPLRETDFDDLYAVASDPLIWEQHPVPDRYGKEFFREFFREHLASGGALVAIDRRKGRIVGTSRFHGYDARRREVEIGWTFLARSHWGGAYNGEMKRLMLEHAFRFVSSVVFLIHPENVRSQRAIEKIGAVRVGTRLDGGGRDSLVYEIRSAARALRAP